MRADLLFRTMEESHCPMRHRTNWPGGARRACDEGDLWAQAAFVTRTDRDSLSVQALQQGHHDTARTPKCLTQFAHSCGSVFGNEFSYARLHALKALT